MSPVARDHWGIFELIIKESGDEGSDGKGRKSEATFPPLSFSFPSLPACALRSFPASLSRASRLSCVLASPPIPSWPWESLWRRQQVRQCKFSGLVNRPRRSRSQRLLPRIKAFPKNFHRSFPQAVCEGKPISTPEMPVFTLFSLELTLPAFIPPLIG